MGRVSRIVAAAVLVASLLAAAGPAGAQGPPTIAINEVHFHPTCAVSYTPCPDAPAEFIELHNYGNSPVDMGGWRFVDGVEHTFAPGSTIAAGGFLTIAEDRAGFAAAFARQADASWRGALSNAGERIALSDATGTIVDQVTYDDGAGNGTWSIAADGGGHSLQLISASNDDGSSVWWSSANPTPGRVNATVGQSPGTKVDAFTWTHHPNPGQPIVVDATVHGAAAVTLSYLINYPGTEQHIAMSSLGASRFRATIPAGLATAGDLVRFRLMVQGRVVAPAPDDSIDWVGTTIADPSVTTELPLLEWFTSSRNYDIGYGQQGDTFSDGVLAYKGEVFDNVGFRIRGQIARHYSWTKRNWKFKLPDHHSIKIDGMSYAIDSLDVQGGFGDGARMREYLGHTIAAEMGLVASEVQHIRVHLNGEYFGLHTLQEHPEGGFLDRNGLDNATLYKGVEGVYESGPGGISPDTTPDHESWDIPDYINLLAAASVIQNNDFGHSNFYWWYDADEHQRFEGMIWDLDLSQGVIYPSREGMNVDLRAQSAVWWDWEIQAPVFQHGMSGPLRPLILRRLRTLADEWLGSGRYREMALAKAAELTDEWHADIDEWGRFRRRDERTREQVINDLTSVWVDGFYAHIVGGGPHGDIPGPQPANPRLSLSVDAAPTDPRREHIRITNHESTAIDVSGWQIRGSTTASLPAGAVLPAGGSAYVVADDTAAGYRAATVDHYVFGEYDAALSDVGGEVELVAPDGSVSASSRWGAGAAPAGLILNEWNAVSANRMIADGDSRLGRVAGNGGDWFELVVVEDHLDVRNWRLEIHDDGLIDQTLEFSNDRLWSDLRAGTIITVAEDTITAADGTVFAEDPSYLPGSDWWIHVVAGSTGSGTYVSAADFRVSNDDWQIAIYDPAQVRRFGPAGEGIGALVDGGVANDQVGELEADPTAMLDAGAAYGDGDASTFGAPNEFAGRAQNFDSLRPRLASPGDVDCDDAITLADALALAQHLVEDRTGASCPVGPGQIDLGAADLTGDSQIDAADVTALLACLVDARCQTPVVN